MAFAYSQLGDIHNAGEAFLHAFQAAKDSGNNILQSTKKYHSNTYYPFPRLQKYFEG